MATAGSIIRRAVRLLTTARTPDADELSEGLEALNARLDGLRNEKLFCHALQTETLPLVNGQRSYAIGPGGDLDTTRPVRIEDAWIEDGANTYDVKIITAEEYDAIRDKTSTSNWPRKASYQGTMPTGTLLVWRVPSQSSSMKLLTRVPLVSLASTSTTVSLPPGWEELLVSELAIVLAPEYEVPVPDSVNRMNTRARNGIKVVDSQPIIASTELPLLVGRRPRANILTDE